MQINNTEKKSFLAFVSGENSFSFFDRVEFLFFYFYIAGSIIILSYFLWNLLFNKMLAYGGFFLVVLLILAVRREKKFTMPYWDYLGRDRLAGLKRAQLINEFDSAAGRFSDQKAGNIVTAVLGVILILFGTYVLKTSWPMTFYSCIYFSTRIATFFRYKQIILQEQVSDSGR